MSNEIKVGETIYVSLERMIEPLVGRIVDVTLRSGQTAHARIENIGPGGVALKVVPDSVKE